MKEALNSRRNLSDSRCCESFRKELRSLGILRMEGIMEAHRNREEKEKEQMSRFG